VPVLALISTGDEQGRSDESPSEELGTAVSAASDKCSEAGARQGSRTATGPPSATSSTSRNQGEDFEMCSGAASGGLIGGPRTPTGSSLEMSPRVLPKADSETTTAHPQVGSRPH